MLVRSILLALALAPVATAAACLVEDPPPAAPSPTVKETIDKVRGSATDALFGFQPSFFADGLTTYDENGQRHFSPNTMELDVSGDFHEDLQASAAFVRNLSATNMNVAFLDYHPFGGMVAPRGRLWVEKGFHVQAGRFDVPFGNDWQFFASKDSVSISRPLTTTEIMSGGYNDAGTRMLGNDGTVNFNVYLMRGFSHGHLLGGRIGFTPFGNPFSLKGLREPKTAEFGFSYFYDEGHDGGKAGWGSAADAEMRLNLWTVRGEYITRTEEPTETQSRTTLHGWHLTQELALGESLPTLFLRFERATIPSAAFSVPDPSADTTHRVVLGLSYTQWSILQLKLECQRFTQASTAFSEAPGFAQTRWYLQIVLVL